MRQKTKITIASMAVMLVMALAVTLISFSFAGETGDPETGTTVAETDTYTNIDYIIKNSHDSSLIETDASGNVISDDTVYRIVEIGSGTRSSLDDYVKTNFGFEKYVINGNKSPIMADDLVHGKVVYHYFNASSVTSESTTNGERDAAGNEITDFAIISQADMIYISNANKPGYSNGNDLSEELVALIQPMAIGKYIPIIYDMPGKTGSNGGGESTPTTSATVGNIIGDYYEEEGRYYYTFAFDDTATGANKWTAATYFDSSLGSKSKYLTINAKTQANKGAYKRVTVGSASGNMANILIVSASGSAYTNASSIASTLLAGATPVVAATDTDSNTAVSGNVVDIQNTELFKKGYNVRYGAYKPKYALIEEKTVDQLETMANLDAYELIIFEADVKTVTAGANTQKVLKAAMYGSNHIAYAKSASAPAGSGSGNGGGNGSSTEADKTNYKKLYDMLSAGDVASYQNVLLSDKTKIDTITGSTSASVAKTIADLINASAYRGIGGPGSTASTFSVLEIQPCYPIDTEIAAANGNTYYQDGDGMINGLSREEIDSQRMAAGLLPAGYEITGSHAGYGYSQLKYEYYAWELSKAKIADALDMDASRIVLTQMSTEELAAQKDEILGNYDLVYIGGNTSAIKDVESYYTWSKMLGTGLDDFIGKGGAGNYTFIYRADDLLYMPVYRMYAHNGDMVSLNATSMGGFVNKLSGTALLKTVDGNAVTSLNGNDLTNDNLDYLKDYVAAGMPIVFSKDVTEVYNYMKQRTGDGKYLQNNIDPDSNMFKLLEYCNGIEAVKTTGVSATKNVLWNFDTSGKDANGNPIYVSSESGRLSAYSNMVRVFDDDNRNALSALYNNINNSKRPKLVLTASPKIYNFFDDSTIITDTELTYKIDLSAVNTTKYSVKLYFDDNGNSKFESSENANPTITKNGNTLIVKATLSDKFFGPLYWKVELTDDSNSKKPKVFVTGLSYVRPENAAKQEVEVLEIMPGNRNVGSSALGEGSHGDNTLYFCADCQQGYKNLYYNPDSYTSTYGNMSYYYSKGLTDDYQNGIDSNGIKMGLHEHHFGIVSYDNALVYDSGQPGGDDFSHNLADDLAKYFDFEIDVMYAEELERYSRDIAAVYVTVENNTVVEMSAADKETKAEDFENKAKIIKELYTKQKAVSDSGERHLREMLGTIKGNLRKEQGGKVDAYTEIMARKTYSQYFAAADDKTGSSSYTVYKVGNDECGVEGFYSQAEFDQLPTKWASDRDRLAKITPGNANYSVTKYTNYKSLYQAWATEHDKTLILKGGYYVNSYTNQYVDWYLKQYYTAYYTDAYKNHFVDEEITAEERKERIKAEVTQSVNTALSVEKPKYTLYNKFYSDGGISESLRIMGYRDFEKFSRYDNWLKDTYTSVLVGASDRFAGGDITGEYSLAAIDNYVDADGQIILFHDVLSPYSDGGAVKLTELIRERAGLDKYHLELAATDSKKNVLLKKPNCSVSFTVNGNTLSKSGVIEFDQWDGRVYKTISVLASGGATWCNLSKDSNGSDLYSESDITYTGEATESNEKITITLTCKCDNNPIPENTDVKFTVGSYTFNKKANSSGQITVEVPAATKQSDYGYYPYFASKNESKYPSSTYFMSNISFKSGDAAHTGIATDIKSHIKKQDLSVNSTYLPGGYTDSYLDVNGDPNQYVNAYKYVTSISWSGINADATDAQFGKSTPNFASDRAKKNNNAIVTMYPYQLADEICLGGTHPQAFATDVEYDNLTVLYSLVGGTPSRANTSTFAANPCDGVDNYFIYACDNIYMCGAGHVKVTGYSRDNLNERYLYMNIICNSVRNSAFMPTINVYDPTSVKDSTTTNLTNEDIKHEEDGSYTYVIDDDVLYPDFSFITGVDKDATVSRVQIYYNLHYSVDGDEDFKEGDYLIADWGGTNMKVYPDVLYYVKNVGSTYELVSNDGVKNFKLRDDFFDSSGCAYIVIKVTDSNGQIIYQRIKIMRKDKLYNLT